MKTLASSFNCRPLNVPIYLTLLRTVSTGQKSLMDISRELGWAHSTVSEKAKSLSKGGFVKILFDGMYRRVVLTDEGRELLDGVEV